jgi:hypothetical protein
MTNIASECRSANIVRDHATILPDDATPKPDGIFGKGHVASSGQSLSCPENRQHVHSLCIADDHLRVSPGAAEIRMSARAESQSSQIIRLNVGDFFTST